MFHTWADRPSPRLTERLPALGEPRAGRGSAVGPGRPHAAPRAWLCDPIDPVLSRAHAVASTASLCQSPHAGPPRAFGTKPHRPLERRPCLLRKQLLMGCWAPTETGVPSCIWAGSGGAGFRHILRLEGARHRWGYAPAAGARGQQAVRHPVTPPPARSVARWGSPPVKQRRRGPAWADSGPFTPRGRPKLHGYCPTASLTGASLRERRDGSGA